MQIPRNSLDSFLRLSELMLKCCGFGCNGSHASRSLLIDTADRSRSQLSQPNTWRCFQVCTACIYFDPQQFERCRGDEGMRGKGQKSVVTVPSPVQTPPLKQAGSCTPIAVFGIHIFKSKNKNKNRKLSSGTLGSHSWT